MQNQKSELQFKKMTETPIPKLVGMLALPTIISMLVTSIYNMADTYFVAQLGTSAAGAVGVVFSLMAIIQAVGFTLGMGAGSQISRLLGKKEYEESNRIASSSFYASLLFGLLLLVIGNLMIDSLMRMLGSTETILPYAKEYGQYILYGAPVMAASFVMNNILRSEGKAALAMVGIAAGGILNILLDPIFIFVFDLGIAGAALATVLSQLISFLLLLQNFLRGRSELKLSPRNISRSGSTYLTILKTGMPSLTRQGLASIASILLNTRAKVYGDAVVAAMSIVSRIFMLIFSALLGLGQGYMPVAGFNYGAGKWNRVRKAFLFTLIVGTVLMTILATGGYIMAPRLIKLFRKEDTEVIYYGTLACRAQCIALVLLPLSVMCNMTFQTIGKPLWGTILSSARQGIFFIPLIVLLPIFTEVMGVLYAQPVADLFTFLSSIPFSILFFQELKRKEE